MVKDVSTYFSDLKTTINEKTGVVCYDFGNIKIHLKNGYLHNDDGPAIEYPNGDYRYYFKGYIHNLNGPAIKEHFSKNDGFIESYYLLNKSYGSSKSVNFNQDARKIKFKFLNKVK